MSDLTAPEAAKYLCLSLRTFYYFVQQGRIPRIIYGPRVTRYEQTDLDAFKKSCRSDSTRRISAGVSSSTVSLAPRELDDLDCFRRAGVKIKPMHTTGRKAALYTLSLVDSKNLRQR